MELAETHGAMELVVRNEGQGPAQNIRFGFEGDPTYFVDNGIGLPIDQVPVIKNGLPSSGTQPTMEDFSWGGCLEMLSNRCHKRAMDISRSL